MGILLGTKLLDWTDFTKMCLFGWDRIVLESDATTRGLLRRIFWILYVHVDRLQGESLRWIRWYDYQFDNYHSTFVRSILKDYMTFNALGEA